jgi:hypothetical protein
LPLPISFTPKSPVCIHICHLCTYWMGNKTICKQFDAIWDALEYILCWNLKHKKSDKRNCH